MSEERQGDAKSRLRLRPGETKTGRGSANNEWRVRDRRPRRRYRRSYSKSTRTGAGGPGKQAFSSVLIKSGVRGRENSFKPAVSPWKMHSPASTEVAGESDG